MAAAPDPQQPPSPAEVLAAISSVAPDRLFEGRLVEVLPREAGPLLVVEHPRVAGRAAVPFLWPDADLEGDSTGEPQNSLESWVSEIGMVLDELFATATTDQLAGIWDAELGLPVIGPGSAFPRS